MQRNVNGGVSLAAPACVDKACLPLPQAEYAEVVLPVMRMLLRMADAVVPPFRRHVAAPHRVVAPQIYEAVAAATSRLPPVAGVAPRPRHAMAAALPRGATVLLSTSGNISAPAHV